MNRLPSTLFDINRLCSDSVSRIVTLLTRHQRAEEPLSYDEEELSLIAAMDFEAVTLEDMSIISRAMPALLFCLHVRQ